MPVSGAPEVVAAESDDELSGPSRRFVSWLIAIVVVGAAVRLAYVWFDRRHAEMIFNDGFYYHHGANLLADGRGFINPFEWQFQGRSLQSADHPPLYLVYLGAFSALGLRSVEAHLLASIVFGIAAVAVAGLLGRRVAGERVGLIAAALVAVYPNTWRYDGALLSEGAVILAVLVVVWLAYRYWDRPTIGRLVAVGAVIGIATLARAELLLLVPLLVVPLGLLTRGQSWRNRIGWAALSSVVCVAVLVPWVGYNRSRFEEPVYLSQNLGSTIAGSYCPSVFDGTLLGYWDFKCPGQAIDASDLPDSSDERADAVARRAGLTYLGDHLDRVPVVVAARLGRITGVYRPSQQRDLDTLTEGVSSWVATGGMITLPFMLVGAVAGGVVLRRRGRVVFPLVAPIACVVVTVVVFYAATRFRSTAEGPLCVLAAVALDALWNRTPWGRTVPSD
ncbi:MAG TPA: glycosyltransferase family 39 protein [Acidimicrobiales bacterium]